MRSPQKLGGPAEGQGVETVGRRREIAMTVVGPIGVAVVVLIAAWVVLTNIAAADDAHRVARAAAAVRADLATLAGLDETADAEPVAALEGSIDRNLDVALRDSGPAEAELLRGLVADELGSTDAGGPDAAERLAALDARFAALAADAGDRADDASSTTVRATYLTAILALAALLAAVTVSGRLRARGADELARRVADDRHRALLAHAPLLVYVVGTDGTVEYASPLAQAVYGRSVARVESFAGQLDPDYAGFARSLVDQTVECGVNHVVKSARGTWFEVHVADRRDDPVINGFVLTARDVSDRVELEQVLRRQANEDVLTGITNRRGLDVALRSALDEAAAAGTLVGVLLIDLDGFKQINDALGHAAGDEALAQIGGRLRGSTRAGEQVARYGGDEFAVVMHPLGSRAEAEAVARRLLETLRMPCIVDGQMVSLGASIGIAVGDAASEPAELLARADQGMYLAKGAGGGAWRWAESPPASEPAAAD